MASDSEVQQLAEIANECRINILNMIHLAGSGHPGGSLSVIDLLVSLFFRKLNWDVRNPHHEGRDRLVLSKGHGVPALYAVLAKKGVLSTDELWTLRKINSRLQGHPDRVLLPFLEASTGSLGQGLSIAQGIALGLKLSNLPARVYCILGDGESQEGQVWEAVMSAPKFKLNNLCVILDNNNGQIDGHVHEVMDLQPIAEKWRAFRWAVQEIDGHNFSEIIGALDKAETETGKPSFIWAHTVKGKGVSFMENNIHWHGVAPNTEELERALGELRGGRV